MDKQTQVDGAVGSDGGGSQGVGQVDGKCEIQFFDEEIASFIGAARVAQDLGIDVRDKDQIIRCKEYFVAGAYWQAREANRILAASPAQAPGLSNTEGTADQSDSTTTNTQTTLPPIIAKSPFKEPPVPQTVNVEEEV